jgi:hypothetical protein
MEAQINVPAQKKIQVYKNDFFNGMILLARKLFMI